MGGLNASEERIQLFVLSSITGRLLNLACVGVYLQMVEVNLAYGSRRIVWFVACACVRQSALILLQGVRYQACSPLRPAVLYWHLGVPSGICLTPLGDTPVEQGL